MPHIEGESLRERIDREKQLGVDDSVAITQKVAGELKAQIPFEILAERIAGHTPVTTVELVAAESPDE